MIFDKIVVIGLGLIGGSVIRHLRRAEAVKEVVGLSHSQSTLDRAVELGIIDIVGGYDEHTFDKAQLVIIATPVGVVEDIMAKIKPYLNSYTVVTDVGSTKSDIVAFAKAQLGEHYSHFVAGHPIAGIERSGIDAAFDGLYTGQLVVLTPDHSTDPAAISMVENLWNQCGAHCVKLDAKMHDEILAATSHLPHVLAFALINMLDEGEGVGPYFKYSAGGFRGFSRIASGDPVMWRDICLANKAAVSDLLHRYQRELKAFDDMLKNDDGDAICEYFARARDQRNKAIDEHDA